MNHETAAQQAARTTEFGFVCNINGIPSQERARYGQLVESLRHAIEERRELPDGYAFQFGHRTNWHRSGGSHGSSWNGSAVRSSGSRSVGTGRTGPYGST
jgi:hypothetical protein